MNDNFAAAMFRKGANCAELVFSHTFNILPMEEAVISCNHAQILGALLYAYLIGACACIQDQASFIELQQAIDNVFQKEESHE